MLWRFMVLALLALALAGAVACGDDDAGDDGGAGTSAPAGDETEPPGATETGEPQDTDEPDGNGGDVTIDLEAADFSFSTETISAPPGSTVTVNFSNTGSAFHTFTVDALVINEQLSGGESTTITFTMPDSETEFHCAFHAGVMNGTLQPGDESAQSDGGSDAVNVDDDGGYPY